MPSMPGSLVRGAAAGIATTGVMTAFQKLVEPAWPKAIAAVFITVYTVMFYVTKQCHPERCGSCAGRTRC